MKQIRLKHKLLIIESCDKCPLQTDSKSPFAGKRCCIKSDIYESFDKFPSMCPLQDKFTK
jgi:hypothetical protein